MRVVSWLQAEGHRAYIYRVATAIGGALTITGVIADGKAGAALLVVGAVMGVGGNGLATVNTTTKRTAHRRVRR